MVCTEHCKKCLELCDMPNVLWLLFGDVLFTIVYVHPEGSVYVDPEIFDKIVCTTMELLDHYNVHNMCFTGDFNARSGMLDDFVFMDDTVSKANPVIPDLVKDCLALPNYDIDVLRKSKDLKTNNFGKCFIQMCQNLDLRIVNGRFGLDSTLPTCKDASVVDYFAISPELFCSTLDMKVKLFNPLLSDVHNVIELHFHPSFLVCNNNDEDVINM